MPHRALPQIPGPQPEQSQTTVEICSDEYILGLMGIIKTAATLVRPCIEANNSPSVQNAMATLRSDTDVARVIGVSASVMAVVAAAETRQLALEQHARMTQLIAQGQEDLSSIDRHAAAVRLAEEALAHALRNMRACSLVKPVAPIPPREEEQHDSIPPASD